MYCEANQADDISDLVEMAELENDRKARSLADPAFDTRWNVIRA